MLLPDDARYAAYSLFVASHGKDVAAVCEVDSALEDSILNVRCACVTEAFTRYQEAYALSMNSGQQSDVCWLLDNASLICVSSALLAFGCERVTGPIIADMPHQSDPQHVYNTVIAVGENRLQPWRIHAAEEVTTTSKGRSAEGVKYLLQQLNISNSAYKVPDPRATQQAWEQWFQK
jgi:hypothetical protein